MIRAFDVSLDFGAELWVGYTLDPTLDLKRSSFAFLFYFIFSERGSQHFFNGVANSFTPNPYF